jgi:FAD binding domain
MSASPGRRPPQCSPCFGRPQPTVFRTSSNAPAGTTRLVRDRRQRGRRLPGHRPHRGADNRTRTHALRSMTMTSAYTIIDQAYDVVIVGAGGAGLRAALGMATSGLKTACVTKVFPTHSHTAAAQGGLAASLENMGDGDNLAVSHVRYRQGLWLARAASDARRLSRSCSRLLPASAAAASNAARASSWRPSLWSRSPRTLGSR